MVFSSFREHCLQRSARLGDIQVFDLAAGPVNLAATAVFKRWRHADPDFAQQPALASDGDPIPLHPGIGGGKGILGFKRVNLSREPVKRKGVGYIDPFPGGPDGFQVIRLRKSGA